MALQALLILCLPLSASDPWRVLQEHFHEIRKMCFVSAERPRTLGCQTRFKSCSLMLFLNHLSRDERAIPANTEQDFEPTCGI